MESFFPPGTSLFLYTCIWRAFLEKTRKRSVTKIISDLSFRVPKSFFSTSTKTLQVIGDIFGL